MSGRVKTSKRISPKLLGENSQENSRVLPPYSYGLLALACLFVTAFTAINDKYNEGMNLVPIVFFTLGFTGLALFGVLKSEAKRS